MAANRRATRGSTVGEGRDFFVRYAAELAQDNGIVHPIGERAVTELEAHFDEGKAQHLLGRHAFGAARPLGLSIVCLVEVLPNPLGDPGIGVQDVADFFAIALWPWCWYAGRRRWFVDCGSSAFSGRFIWWYGELWRIGDSNQF